MLQPKSNGLHPKSDGLQPNGYGLQPNSDGLHPRSNGLQPKSNGLHPKLELGSWIFSVLRRNLVGNKSNWVLVAETLSDIEVKYTFAIHYTTDQDSRTWFSCCFLLFADSTAGAVRKAEPLKADGPKATPADTSIKHET